MWESPKIFVNKEQLTKALKYDKEQYKMWKSPIDIIYNDIQTQFEDNVLKAVHNVNIFVDREELIKALAYDRGQYEKGYHDGISEARKIGKWIFNPRDGIEAMFTKPKCSICGFESADGFNYCPNCGALMREVE